MIKTDYDYIKLILKRLKQRKDIHNMLVSKREVSRKLKEEIISLQDEMNALDRRITVLTP